MATMNAGVSAMTKHAIDVDDELLTAAQHELQTTGLSDTGRAALQQAVTMSARARHVEWLRAGGLAEMADPDRRGAV
jgi:Arc/MetJ family transcription regulator